MRLRSVRWVLLPLVLLVLPVFAQRATEYHQGHEVAAGQVLVKFKTKDLPTRLEAQWLEDVDRADAINSDGIVRMHSRSKDTDTLINDLTRRPDVVYAEPDYIVHAIAIPNDPNYGQLWGLKNTGQAILGVTGQDGADIGAESAWNVTTGTQAVVIGVVDSGIDYTHPDLAANVWNNPTGVGGCPAGTHGYNAITRTCDPMDDFFHGTHVSGTIGAVGNNSVGVVGVNWTTSIMGLKFLDSAGNGTTSDAIAAIEFAIQAKISGVNVRVLSNSWGGSGFSQSLSNEISRANANDILFVVAAGNASADNDVTPDYPANFNLPNIIAVAATDNLDNLASFSNYGPTTVYLGAPGVSVLSTVPGAQYEYLSGTSMATPHVAGAAALILSTSTLTTAQLKNRLLMSVDPIPSLAGKTVTGGRLNVCRAIPACILPSFSLSSSTSSMTVPSGGGTAVYGLSIAQAGGFTAPVNLSVSGLPAGVTAVFSANPATGTSSTLTLTASASAAAGSYGLTVTGTGGYPTASTSSATITLVESAAAPPPVVTWTKVAIEGQTVFLPAGTTYRFGIGTSFLAPVTTTVDETLYVYYTTFGGDPAPGVVKELDVEGNGAGVLVNGVPFTSGPPAPPPAPPPVVTWTKVAIEGDTVFLPAGTTYRFGIGTSFLAPVTTTVDETLYVYYTTFGGDPAPGVVKELDVEGNGAGVLVNGVPFTSGPPTPPPAPPPVVTWTKVATEGETVFLPSGTTYRFGIGASFLAPVTTTADETLYVYYTTFGGDPAPGVVKELDVEGNGAGVIVNGVPFVPGS
jgi:subtilisin family serine protease